MVVVEFPWWIYPVLVWSLFWKGIAMWRSARNNQIGWFVASLVINSFGLISIIYLFWFQEDWNVRGSGKKGKKIARRRIRKVRKFPKLFR